MQSEDKEVYFSVYCDNCKYKDYVETDDPCNDCLAQPFNLNSHKPIMFKEKE